jgi:hypothetical protein
MSDQPDPRRESPDREHQKPLGDNALLQLVQQPRILLVLLAAWEIVAVLLEFLASSGYSLDIDRGLDGVLAGRLLSWQAIPLAILYLYCARDPVRYSRIFWLALIEQAAAIAANLYHWGADHLEPQAIFIPIAVSAALGALAFLNVFQRGEPEREYA